MSPSDVITEFSQSTEKKVVDDVYVRPSIESVRALSESQRASLRTVSVGRDGFGEVSFDVSDFDWSAMLTATTGTATERALRGALSWTGHKHKITNVELRPVSDATLASSIIRRPARISVYLDKPWGTDRVRRVVERRAGVSFLSYDRDTNSLKFRVPRL